MRVLAVQFSIVIFIVPHGLYIHSFNLNFASNKKNIFVSAWPKNDLKLQYYYSTTVM